MITPLRRELTERSISAENLSQADIEFERASELLAGANPTIEEIRSIARAFRIPARSLITDRIKAPKFEHRLRENVRADLGELKHLEGLRVLYRADFLSEVLPARTLRSFFIAISHDEKTFQKAEELALLCRQEMLGIDVPEPLIHLEQLVAINTSAYVLPLSLRYLEGVSVVASGARFIFIAKRNDPRMRFTLAHELCHYLVDLPLRRMGDGSTMMSIQFRADFEWTSSLRTPLPRHFCSLVAASV